MVGSAPSAAQSEVPIQQKDQGDDIAEGQRGVPTVGLPALDQHVTVTTPFQTLSVKSPKHYFMLMKMLILNLPALLQAPSVRCKSIYEMKVPGYTQTMIAMK